jgi:hypothetical protein
MAKAIKTIKITSYYIDKENTLHTWMGQVKHVTISDVTSDEQAEELIEELNAELED